MLKQRARSQEAKNHKRSIIIDSAKQLYLFESSSIPTLSEIANDAKMTKGNIYNYFKTKEDIYLYILQEEYRSWFYSFGIEPSFDNNFIINRFKALLENELFMNLNSQIETNLIYSFVSTHIEILAERISNETKLPKDKIFQKFTQSFIVISGSNHSNIDSKLYKTSAINDLLEMIW
jgi:AcrR family transcriptional regulator